MTGLQLKLLRGDCSISALEGLSHNNEHSTTASRIPASVAPVQGTVVNPVGSKLGNFSVHDRLKPYSLLGTYFHSFNITFPRKTEFCMNELCISDLPEFPTV